MITMVDLTITMKGTIRLKIAAKFLIYFICNRKLNELFGVQVFTDKTPSVYREYGAPLFDSNFK